MRYQSKDPFRLLTGDRGSVPSAVQPPVRVPVSRQGEGEGQGRDDDVLPDGQETAGNYQSRGFDEPERRRRHR